MFKTMHRLPLALLLIPVFLLPVALSARAQTLPDSLRAKVSVEVRGDEGLVGPTRQYFQLHLIAAGALLDEETPHSLIEVKVVPSKSAPEWIAVSMITSQPVIEPKKPKGKMSTSELESGAWVKEFVAREMIDARIFHQHEVVLVTRDELEGAVQELVEHFRLHFIEPMQRFWLERQH